MTSTTESGRVVPVSGQSGAKAPAPYQGFDEQYIDGSWRPGKQAVCGSTLIRFPAPRWPKRSWRTRACRNDEPRPPRCRSGGGDHDVVGTASADWKEVHMTACNLAPGEPCRKHPVMPVAALVFFWLAGCRRQAAPAPPMSMNACLLPGEQPMLVAELFFGRNIKARGPLTDAEWAQFVAETITPNFPEGFTVFDGQGQWRNPLTGNIADGRTKIVLIAAKREPDLTRRLSSVIDIYKTQFRQQSVGTIIRKSCAAF